MTPLSPPKGTIMSNPVSKYRAWSRGIKSRHPLKRRLLFGIYGCHLIEKEARQMSRPSILVPIVPVLQTDKTSDDS